MYYYIFDLKKCQKRSQVEEIKNYLSVLGISGEFVYPSAAYNVSELVELGLSKKYNTIVGIGGDEIANKIAAGLVGRSEAMGLIPIEASLDLMQLIGAKNWREGADNLRYRRIAEMFIGQTANGGAFLTSLELNVSVPTEITIEFKDYIVQARVTKLLITNFHTEIKKIGSEYLDVVFQSIARKGKSVWTSVSSFLGFDKNETQSLSIFRARSLRLFTNSQIALKSGTDVVARTPQLVEISDAKLRLIVNRKNFS